MTFVPREDSDQLGHTPNLIRLTISLRSFEVYTIWHPRQPRHDPFCTNYIHQTQCVLNGSCLGNWGWHKEDFLNKADILADLSLSLVHLSVVFVFHEQAPLTVFIMVDRISMELSILYFKGMQVKLSIKWCFSVCEYCFTLANSADSDEMLHCVAFHLVVHC